MMNATGDLLLERVHDTATCMRLADLVSRMLDEPIHFSLDWLQDHQWTAVPVADLPNDMDAEWISEAAERIGCSEAFAVSTEPESPDSLPACYRVALNQPGLLALEDRMSDYPLLVTPPGGEFAILIEGELFFVVAGPRSFVREAIGCSFATAQAMFLNRYARSDHWTPTTRDFLVSVWDRYAEVHDF